MTFYKCLFIAGFSLISSRSKLYIDQSLAMRGSSLALAIACSGFDALGSTWSGVDFGIVRSAYSFSCLFYDVGRRSRGPHDPCYGRICQ